MNRRDRRRTAVAPPAGMKWWFRTSSGFAGALGVLELWESNVTIDALGLGRVNGQKDGRWVTALESEPVYHAWRTRAVSKRILRQLERQRALEQRQDELRARIRVTS